MEEKEVYNLRKENGIIPVYKIVDKMRWTNLKVQHHISYLLMNRKMSLFEVIVKKSLY